MANTVYRGFANETKGCNFSGPKLSYGEIRERIAFAPARGAKVVAINTFPHTGNKVLWNAAVTEVETARVGGAGAVILADLICSPMPRPIIPGCA